MKSKVKVVFCDLDGTLVLDNSFHIFLSACWKFSSSAGRVGLAMRLAPRILGRIGGGHAGLKRRILNWVTSQSQDWQDRVVAHTMARLRHTFSAPVLRHLDHFRAGGALVVLATAAPNLYASRLAVEVGADDCLATPTKPGPGWAELLGERKAQACAEWLERHMPPGSPRQIVVITDHSDDVPLLEMADMAVLQATSHAMDEIVLRISAERAIGAYQPPTITRIDVLAPQHDEGGGYWLWFDDRPEGPVDVWEIKTILSKHRHARIYAGNGRWRLIRPGEPITPAERRHDCPRPPGSRQRLIFHLRRRVMRDWLGLFH